MLILAKWLLGIDSVVLILVVLLQSGRSAGLSGAIAGGAEQIVGRKARGMDAVLGRVTAVAAFIFMALALWVAWLIVHR
ncbi:MAG: preprotein translocase subunit SecG [Bacilli bacterium]|nr:preprotein translocase subunit SecG [Bacilli bacterium]